MLIQSRPCPRLLLHACATLVLIGCGSDATSGPESAGVTVRTNVDRDPVSPGQTVSITVTADPLGSAQVRWITVVTTGAVEQRDSAAFNAVGPQQLTVSLRIPGSQTSGSVMITGSASAGSGTVTSQTVLNVVDVEPPVIASFFATPPAGAIPGDVIRFAFTGRDTVGVKRVKLRIENSFVGADSVVFDQPSPFVSGIIQVPVPAGAALGFPAIATLTVLDASGLAAEAKVNVSIVDPRPPGVLLELGGLRSDLTIGSGQPLDLKVTATDNHGLRYIGYHGGGLRDSVAVSGPAVAHTFRITVPAEWRQTRPVVTSWARDVAGNLSPVVLNTAKEIPVFDWVDRPFQMTAVGHELAPLQVLWDERRSVAYFLLGYNARIEVVHVPSGTRGTPIPLPTYPHSFALTASGDSLVVTLPDSQALGVIDLRQAVRSTVLVPLQIATEDSEILGPFTRKPEGVQISGSHVFVTLVHGLFVARLLDVNLATGTQVIRSDLAGGADLPQRPSFFRLNDGRLLLAAEAEYYLPNEFFVYEPGTDSFTRTSKLRAAGRSQFSASPSGQFMLRSTVFNAAFDSVGTVSSRDWKEDYGLVAELSPDATVVYTGTFYGLQKVRAADGFILEQYNFGYSPPLLLYALPDGSRLIAIGHLPGTITGEWGVRIIDLR